MEHLCTPTVVHACPSCPCLSQDRLWNLREAKGGGPFQVSAPAAGPLPRNSQDSNISLSPVGTKEAQGSDEHLNPDPEASKCHAPEIPLWSRGLRPQGHALPPWALHPLWNLLKVAISGSRWRVGLSGWVSGFGDERDVSPSPALCLERCQPQTGWSRRSPRR